MGRFGRECQLALLLSSKRTSTKNLGKNETIAHENRQNGGFTCFEVRLTFKMGRFGLEGQLPL
ncbi:hypothetical protein H5410_000062 [Solanum commersonii]|uniref:Uncharacterized protein n=1 Tax=Solanum commersonii TaxID=4109 RepID=A0A9J6AVF5_SOLCO|nr:hypothetical protein H5410_000062 [Solanum commersonii]